MAARLISATPSLASRSCPQPLARPARLRIQPAPYESESPIEIIHVYESAHDDEFEYSPGPAQLSIELISQLIAQNTLFAPHLSFSPARTTCGLLRTAGTSPALPPRPTVTADQVQPLVANIHSTLGRIRTITLALYKYWSSITVPATTSDCSPNLSTSFLRTEATRLAATHQRLRDFDSDLRDLLTHISDHMPGPVYEQLEIEWRQEYRGLDVKVFKVRDELVATHCFWKVNYALCAKSTGEAKE